MKTWYRAVCDEHKEAVTVMVNNPHYSYIMLAESTPERNDRIHRWLSRHYGCSLRLIHDGMNEDFLWEGDWKTDTVVPHMGQVEEWKEPRKEDVTDFGFTSKRS